jgi:hypothetical protein
MKAGIGDVLFVIPFFVLILRVFFNSPTIPTYEAGCCDVLLFCDSFLCVWS